jgi:hypothetical protein
MVLYCIQEREICGNSTYEIPSSERVRSMQCVRCGAGLCFVMSFDARIRALWIPPCCSLASAQQFHMAQPMGLLPISTPRRHLGRKHRLSARISSAYHDVVRHTTDVHAMEPWRLVNFIPQTHEHAAQFLGILKIRHKLGAVTNHILLRPFSFLEVR